MAPRDWVAWHDPYDDDGSALHRRLHIVQRHIAAAVDCAPEGTIRAVSLCAGQGRDLIGALAVHPRRADVVARLVELDERNVELARAAARTVGLEQIEVVAADASMSDVYEGAVPAELVLVCGVFGNISDPDIMRTIEFLPRLCAENGTVIWTRHRRPPDATPAIRACFETSGFDEVAFDAPEDLLFAVGVGRLRTQPAPLRHGVRLFDFVRPGRALMRFDHLALPVRDPDRSLTFYTDVVGLTGTTRRESDGLLLTTPEGFVLALLAGEPPRLDTPFHFGISASTPDEVRATRRRLQELGVDETEWADETDYVSTKVRDPDGYVVEISWERAGGPDMA